MKRMSREGRGFLGLAALVLLALLGAHAWLRRTDEARQQELLVRDRKAALELVLEPRARELEQSLRVMYESARTVALLPGVRKISGANRANDEEDVVAQGRFSDDAALTVQQLYNNLAANLAVSEVYAVLDGFHPEAGEVPFFMYDELILSDRSRDAEDTRHDDDAPEESEAAEYQHYLVQLAALRTAHPRFDFEHLDDIPAMSSPLMRTCDNSQYTSVRDGDVHDTAGLLYSVPFYRPDGAFNGIISIVLRTNVLEAKLLGLPLLPLSAAERAGLARQGLKLSPTPARFVLSNRARGLEVFDRRFAEAPAVLRRAKADQDPNLLRVPLRLHDDDAWELSLLFDPAAPSVEREAAARLALVRRQAVDGAGVGVLAMGALVWLARRRAERRLSEFAERMAGFAEGRSALDSRIDPAQFSGGLRAVATHFNRFLGELGRIVLEVRQTSGRLVQASEVVSQTAQQASTATVALASSMKDATDSVATMSTAIDSSAKETRKAGELARHASSEATRGEAAVRELLAAMRRIDARLQEIEGIGRETNLLSLNAAVEAARVGTAGDGFAIVAGEVKRLADRVRQTATEIEASQEQSAALASTTGSSLERMVTEIVQTAALAEELASSATTQAQGAARLGASVTELSEEAQQNAAALQQLAATATALCAEAGELDGLMQFFRFEAAGPGDGRA